MRAVAGQGLFFVDGDLGIGRCHPKVIWLWGRHGTPDGIDAIPTIPEIADKPSISPIAMEGDFLRGMAGQGLVFAGVIWVSGVVIQQSFGYGAGMG